MKNRKLKKWFFIILLIGMGNTMYVSAESQDILQSPRKVTGRVMDVTGELLIGVNVMEVGTTNGTVTDINGTYTITVTSQNPELRFTYVGFRDRDVRIGNQGIIDVTLEEDVEALDEVVVVGFGTQKKASVVGSITNVEPGKLSLTPSRSLSNNLAGMVSGVIAVQRSGNPWFNNSDFWIRGISTFTGNANPMVLVDGIERSIHDIDPEEIESFSVLKDAAASAVYGVRGANGVIMINTKRGKIGKPQVDVRFERAYTSPIKLLDYVGSVKYLELMNEMNADNGQAPFVSEATLQNYKYQTDPELYPDVNWWEVVAKDQADNTKANISINGGSDILRYSLVLGYYGENGIIRRDPNQEWDSSLKVSRYNVRSNVDVNVTPTTLLRVNLGGFLQTKNAPPGNEETDFGIFYQAMRIPPYVHPPIYADGRIPRVFAKENPWAWATQRGFEKINHSKIEALTAIEQDLKFITPGLKAKLSFAFDKFSGNTVTRAKTPDYYNPASARDADGNIITTISHHGEQFLGHSRGADWGDQSIYLEGMVSYNRIFNDVHDVNTMILYNQKDYDRGDALPYRNQGIAGRFSYTYDRRYVGEFNFGYNGSENFAPGKRFGFFPAVALGWIISQEKFMQPVSNIVSNLKIRGSVGQAGNSILGRNIWDKRFAYISTIVDTGSYTWGTENNIYRLGRAEGEIGVPNLTWETVTKSNIGFELGLWNNSVNYTIDVFKEKREDIFMARTNVPGSAGFNRVIWANFGKVDNQGIDMSLNINRQINKDWFVSAIANYTYAHNQVVEIDEPASIVGTYRSQTGKPVGQLFGLIAEGLFTADDFDENGRLKEGIPVQNFSDVNNLRPGDIKYKDMNGDGAITALDRTAIGGTRIPEIIYGFGANLKYKAVDFGFFFQGAGKTYQLLGGENWLPGSVLGAGNIFSNVDDRWTPENPSQDVFWPRLGNRAVANNEQASTWWLRNMSFLRLKNIEVGYNFPRTWVNKIGVRDCRLFIRGSNLLTFSKFKLWDPELETTDGLKYPQMKSVSVGLNINFNN
ncbi:TonB-linked outer membrane protein, SusC/RagA family [Porphyromonadaceae bacterium KH3CP3RA]|nr:TonB-linked outer membrane protein, SusC/RagA family [Porphyromonadaceae bacterium KH3CP3RA]